MAEIPFAAYDPVFFAHHVMPDRIRRLRHPTAGIPRDLLDEALPPFNITVAQAIDVTALGYDYASFSSRTTGSPGRFAVFGHGGCFGDERHAEWPAWCTTRWTTCSACSTGHV